MQGAECGVISHIASYATAYYSRRGSNWFPLPKAGLEKAVIEASGTIRI